MRKSATFWATAGLLASLCGSCTEPRDLGDNTLDSDAVTPAVPVGCVGCHGTETSLAPTDKLHKTHLGLAPEFGEVTCESCHIVPETAAAVGHLDTQLPAEVNFSGWFTKLGPAAYDVESKTCSSVACHGALLDADVQGPLARPVWDPESAVEATCSACHGEPPAEHHPQVSTCEQCHVVTGDHVHANGVVDMALPTDCSACHGDEASPAPTDALHRRHLFPTSSQPVNCTTCHATVSHVVSAGHMNGTVELVFSGPALKEGGPAATWDGVGCAATACHDGHGAETPVPVWKTTLGDTATCTACHGGPPPLPHFQIDNCTLCHGAVVDSDGVIAPEKHVDGTVTAELPTSCSACHGEGDSPAPTDLTHKKHLDSTIAVVACADCHVVPNTVEDEGHIDSGLPAEVTFSGLAVANGAMPDYVSPTCSSVYCHSDQSQNWGTATAEATVCTACHAMPPAGDHPMSDRCDVCHSAVLPSVDGAPVAALHIDGVVEVVEAPACNSCHGHGDSKWPTTGAHATHESFGVACETCHLVPSEVTDAGHLDSAAPAELTFGGLATQFGATPIWDAVAQTCSNTYCHGGPGAATPAPIWTGTGQANCGGCHSLPPPTPHPVDFSCSSCHPATVGTEDHVNGSIDFDL